jgi:hypothetical protein
MKKSGILVSLLLSTVALTSCGKSSNSSAPSTSAVITPPTTTQQTQPQTTIPANHSVKAINLRTVNDFAMLAHAGITSIPASAITGKVGVRPGKRTDITLTPEEVTGGATQIYAGDDRDATNAAFITQAKIDLINAYNEAETRTPDADKIDLYGGALGNKILPAGIYKWNSRVTIPNDLTLEGNDTDVWVFKVAGDLRVGSDVTIKLSGGAKASNVYWQVGDNTLIKAHSSMVGTVMTQLTFEMKEQSSLEGRAFSKNDKIILDKNTIKKPE